VWYYQSDDQLLFIRRGSGNTLWMFQNWPMRVIQTDLLGNELYSLHPTQGGPAPASSTPVNVPVITHDVSQMPSGNFLLLGAEVRQVKNFPTSETNPNAPAASAWVVGDTVIEVDPSGAILNEWSLLDLLQPTRVAYDSHWGAFPWLSPVSATKYDWSHANSVFYDPTDDGIMVSLRNQDVVFKFSRGTGNVLWLLGPPANWDPALPLLTIDSSQAEGTSFLWQYHQHNATITRSGTILLYDDGNYRASPFDGTVPTVPANSYSRAVEYAVDPTTMQIRQVWEYGPRPGQPGRLFTQLWGGAEEGPSTGNVLVTFGGVNVDSSGNFTNVDANSKTFGRIVEVTHTNAPQVLFNLTVGNPDPSYPYGWGVYQAALFPGVYP
jgi:hypothetical protein